MVKHLQHFLFPIAQILIALFPIALFSIALTGCATHQDLLAPANTGPMMPVNTYWTAPNKVPDKEQEKETEKQTPAKDQ